MSELKSKFGRVMVIDDNQIDLYIAGKIIISNHFSESVIPFDSALAALAYLKQHHNQPQELPEIIFVDIYMPLMSGFEFLDAYNNLSSAVKQHCRVYVVSSSIDDADIRRVNEDENVVGFGVKPLTKSFLNTINPRMLGCQSA